ncbi:MAG: VOC family protein [Anaerolineales bacterium]|nr:VOC family protein [Anaerolineales bacterium]
MINGLFETHINVTDLERSMAFYGEVLGLELGLLQEERRIAFYWLGGRGEAMLGLWERPELVQRQHFAFRSTVDDIRERVVPFLKGKGLAVHNFLEDDTERPLVFGWMPAIAIYFTDPDGHSLEFIAMLPDEPRPEVGQVTWDVWQQLQESVVG